MQEPSLSQDDGTGRKAIQGVSPFRRAVRVFVDEAAAVASVVSEDGTTAAWICEAMAVSDMAILEAACLGWILAWHILAPAST